MSQSPNTRTDGQAAISPPGALVGAPAVTQTRLVFDQPGDFRATRAAEKWLAQNGYSVAAMQGAAPRGIMRGNFLVAKWRNLTAQERSGLHGALTGDGRNGPVVVQIGWQS